MKRNRRRRFLPAVALWVFLPILSQAQSNDTILSTFEIHPEFKIELVAREPLIVDPVDLEFDEAGRAFVIEMPGYPFPDTPGRIVLLGDDDNDGIYDSRTVFAEGFAIAASILSYDGGLLVASPPDLIFVKDTDGDNVADLRETLLAGFDVGNQQHNFNGLTHGLDNWIYGANGGNGGKVYWPGRRSEGVSIRGYDFRVNLRAKIFERVGRTSGGFGLAMDNWGNIFGTHNLYHIRHLVFPGRYIEGVAAGRAGTLTLISDHEDGGLGRIFPIGKQASRVNHPEQAGYFSGACGITFYGGGAFPEGFDDNVFVADVVLNLIHRDRLNRDGTTFKASRTRERVEFLASTDRAFRPVNMTVGPNGALYVLDMHRDVIEHPEWIPDEIEETMDLDAGKEKGRIFRITPKNGLPNLRPKFDRGDVPSVVANLEHENRWRRDTAQRLLVEWRDEAAVPHLRDLLRSSKSPFARVHAMWTLHGLGALDEDSLRKALADSSPGVRENAVVAAHALRDEFPAIIVNTLIPMAKDGDPRVRMYVALVLGDLPAPRFMGHEEAIITIARRDVEDPWTRLAVAAAGDHLHYYLLDGLMTSPSWCRRDGADELLGLLAGLVGRRGSEQDVTDTLATVSRDRDIPLRAVAEILEGLGSALSARSPKLKSSSALRESITNLFERNDGALARGAWKVAKALSMEPGERERALLKRAAQVVGDSAEPTARRLDQLALYAFENFNSRAPLLYDLLDTRQPLELQKAAMDQLADRGSTDVAERLLSVWRSLGRETRKKASDILLYRRNNHRLLLAALEEGTVSLGEMNFHLERRRTLLWSRDEEIATRAKALFNDAGVVTRKEAIERMRPALETAGDAAKGHEVYRENCSKCHILGDEGTNVGPNLTDIFRKSAATLLHDILDPNAAVGTEYISYTVMTNDGRVYSGMIASESDETVTLREGEGIEHTFNRREIKEMYAGGLSVMPEELETGFDVQAMADLLAFLQQPR